MRSFVIFLMAAAMIIPSAAVVSEAGNLKLATVVPENSPNFKIISAVLKEAFQRSGISVTIVSWPGKRGILEADAGRIDGDALRIQGMCGHYPNLVQVSEPIRRLDMHAYVTDGRFDVKGWPSLAPYSVITKSGIKVVEKGLKGIVPPEKIYEAPGYEQAFAMLARKRGDLLIASPSDADAILKKERFQGKGIRMLEPPVHSMELFTYMHKKHADLALKIAATLKEMKADGTYNKLISK